MSALSLLDLQISLGELSQRRDLLSSLALCLNFHKSLPGKLTLKFLQKLFLIFTALKTLLVVTRVKRLAAEEARFLSNFDYKAFEKAYGGAHAFAAFPGPVRSFKDLIMFLLWTYTSIAQPMFNQPQKQQTEDLPKKGMTGSHPVAVPKSTIKKSFGSFSMINLNDLVIYFDEFALELREVHMPSLVLRMDKLFQRAPTTPLLCCIRDLSNRVPFLTAYAVHLLDRGEYLRVQAVLRELSMLKIEQMSKYC